MTTATATDEPTAYPAAAPPPILPWNNFDTTEDNDRARVILLIAEILQDDEWHYRDDVIAEITYEYELPRKAVSQILYHLRVHGDIRQTTDDEGDWLRLTTRWRGWTPDA
ncbi:hypothetical protein [Mycolicibacterium mageritense]|uniref:Uncharacterized protein n=1 Tax=Mycolicibacterium mageritense TaxID=53462 RepID=A0AAI8U366_MYCME|nr:hypothetical protein [Mycolicibacterium mageritense]BDY33186.1 hypothetical protein hbim_07161 [Mycolicibacterium mageritense]